MPNTGIAYHHTHLISADPQAAASWYVDKLGGEIKNSAEVKGAPSINVVFDDVILIIRGQRPGENVVEKKDDLQWGVDYIGFVVRDDFDAYCDNLKSKGVRFTMEPVSFSPRARIAFIVGPDGESIELVHPLN